MIHDDLMDSSDLRRGRPARHRQFEALHANAGWLGDSAAFGGAGAILLGDLLLMWSAQMLHSADGVDQSALERALPIVEAMRTEVTCGQYLDMVAQAHPLRAGSGDRGAEAHYRTGIGRRQPEQAEYKAARCRAAALPDRRRYPVATTSCTSPSALTAHRWVGPSSSGMTCWVSSGIHQVTGKPAGDDLREGKRTVLVAHAYAHSSDDGQKLLLQRLGDPGLDATGINELRQVIVESGARDAVESMISSTTGERSRRCTMPRSPRRVAPAAALADAAVRREFLARHRSSGCH